MIMVSLMPAFAYPAAVTQIITITLLVVGAVFVLLWLVPTSTKPKGTQFPPGPRPRPFVGNIPDVPLERPWLSFKQLSDKYGPFMRLRLLGKEHIVLSTEKIANDLLRERGSTYSSRAQTPSLAHFLSGDLRPVFLPYNDRWRNGRKFMHHVTNNSVAGSYEPSQSLESLRMLRDLVREPARYQHWFHRYSAGIIYRLAFGKAIVSGDEQVVHDIETIVGNIQKVSVRGSYLVDRFPVLMNLPTALAPFKQELAKLHNIELDIFRRLMSDVEHDIDRGQTASSWEREMIEQRGKFNLSTDEGAYVVGTLFEAGAGTTDVAMQTWLLCAVLHPEWWAKMQAEIDSVCTTDRLPTLSDMPSLPIVRSFLKESMRWRPVFPDGIPHMSVKDDTYQGCFIPAGSIVHANIWAIHHDPELYPDPETFNPQRWLDPSYPTYREPLTTFPNLHNFSMFGFGRRICPGQNLAERSLNLLTARIVWSCRIAKARDANGHAIDPPLYQYSDSVISEPESFPLELEARDQGRLRIIELELEKSSANDPLRN